MADVYLGPSESEATLLPPIRWMGGGSPGLPIDYAKQLDRATMLSGGLRFNFRLVHPRRWQFAWEALTIAEVNDFLTLREYDTPLWFQNNWEDAEWREVMISTFEISPVVNMGGCTGTGARYGEGLYEEALYDVIVGGPRWNLSMTLEEVIG
jgi:hypothetical protein